ncbi:MAG TPA: beta-galactosidase GalB [Candidatus Binatia bacterium]|jgi:beta-galactosidase|nr:beta-galactosidase GalB [Candidatus Binatia bacterium]
MTRFFLANFHIRNRLARERSAARFGRWCRDGMAFAVFILMSPALLKAAEPASSPRERLSFNSDWRFIKGDPAGSEGKLDYQTLKPWLLASGPEFSVNSALATRPQDNPAGDVVYTLPACDDTSWRKLNLPHDWGIEGPFKQEYPGETGKLPWWGVAWYRKHFSLPMSDSGKKVFLDMDGAMAYASVWLNGQFVGGWPYGYASWELELTPFLKFGGENVVAIRLDNPQDSSRWYPGGGIYRNVWLIKTAPVHIGHWGTFVSATVEGKTATVNLKANVENSSPAGTQIRCGAEVYECNAEGQKWGRPVLSFPPALLKLGAHATGEFATTGAVHSPRLWSVKKPNRYVAVTSLEQDGKIVDTHETLFGIRTLQFTADNGFMLNGERIALNGVCDHHDLGALGSAVSTRALERQLQILQEMGCNAIRTSHNPPAPELLDLCDRMGFVVMDEAFDCWLQPKKKNDYHLLFADWHEKDLRAMIRRDRNHPCIILWSIGNEISEQGSPNGPKMAGELAAIVHSEDRSRPVTSACNNGRAGYNGWQKEMDVFGYNYRPYEYGRFREANPALALFGSETASCVSSRGEYFFPVSTNQAQGRADFQVSSYDLYAPPWATPPDREFHGQDEFPFVAGEFVWTGFDYLGEPTPYGGDIRNPSFNNDTGKKRRRNTDVADLLNFTDPAERARLMKDFNEQGRIQVPSRSSYFGIIDLAGFKKDRFYLYQARWRPDLHMAHILPHWNWPDRIGQVTPVHVYTSGDEAELFLNGKSLGRKKRGPLDYRIRWDDVVYKPGVLEVVAFNHHTRWAHDSVRTTGPAEQLLLAPERTTLKPDGQDLSYVTATVADKGGLQVPRSKNHISFEISGPGEIIATDNGDATCFESFQAKDHSAYNGLCLAIVRSTGEPGTIVLKATSPGLKATELKLQVKADKR